MPTFVTRWLCGARPQTQRSEAAEAAVKNRLDVRNMGDVSVMREAQKAYHAFYQEGHDTLPTRPPARPNKIARAFTKLLGSNSTQAAPRPVPSAPIATKICDRHITVSVPGALPPTPLPASLRPPTPS